MSQQPDTQEELPPEIRACMVDKLAEILVWVTAKPTASLFPQMERTHRIEVNHDTRCVVRTVFIRRAAAGEGDDALTVLHRQILRRKRREIFPKRSRKIFTIISPQLLGISLCIRSRCPQTHAHFSIAQTSLPKK